MTSWSGLNPLMRLSRSAAAEEEEARRSTPTMIVLEELERFRVVMAELRREKSVSRPGGLYRTASRRRPDLVISSTEKSSEELQQETEWMEMESDT